MSPQIELWFDFICPYSLITRKVLADTVAGADVTTRWHPFEVNPDCVEEAGEYPRGVWENSVRPLAGRRGVALSGPPGTPLRRARLAFVGYQYALDSGAADAYSERIFAAYFHGWKDISDPAVLTEAAVEAGMDRTEFRTALMSPRYAGRHRRADSSAREAMGITMVPVLTIGDWRLDGVPTREQLLAALEGDGDPAGRVTGAPGPEDVPH